MQCNVNAWMGHGIGRDEEYDARIEWNQTEEDEKIK